MASKADIAAAAAVGNLEKLRELGVSLKRAVKLCEAAAKTALCETSKFRNETPSVQKQALTACETPLQKSEPEPQPKLSASKPAPLPFKQMGIIGMDRAHIAAPRPEPAPAAPQGEPEAEWVSMNQLHELSIHVESGYSSPDSLMDVGFSKSTAEEVSRAINAARKGGYGLAAHQVPLTAAAVAERINKVLRKEDHDCFESCPDHGLYDRPAGAF